MKIVKCKNVYKEPVKPCRSCGGSNKDCHDCGGSGTLNPDTAGRNIECNRILAVLTDLQVDILRVDSEKPIFWCPRCQSEQRWIEIGNEDGRIIFRVLDEHPEFKDELKYDELIICQQVG